MRRRFTLAFALLSAALAGAAAPPPEVHIDRLPRPHSRTRGAAMVDARLAAMEQDYRARAGDCVSTAKQARLGSRFNLGARRLLETPTLYSIEIRTDWYCGTAYPDRAATAATFDLRTGKPYNLSRAFHVGEGHLTAAALPVVMRFRLATLQRMKDIGDCGTQSAPDIEQALQSAEFSLGITRADLIFYFDVPHVIAACFPPVQVPLTALAGLTDLRELRRLGLARPAKA